MASRSVRVGVLCCLGLVLGCGDDVADKDCEPGALGCSCLDDGRCERAELECLSGLCVVRSDLASSDAAAADGGGQGGDAAAADGGAQGGDAGAADGGGRDGDAGAPDAAAGAECQRDADCDDDQACNGQELCGGDGRCHDGAAPDPGESCRVRGVDGACDQQRCVPLTCGNGDLDEGEDCDDGRDGDEEDGCRDDCGFTCLSASDCIDAVFCDGEEFCTAEHRCAAGTPQTCDDAEICTVDMCDGALDRCVHVAMDDGVSCGSGSICLAGDCSASRCGDGYVDAEQDEQCEDENATAGDGCEPDTCRYSCEQDEDCDDAMACDGGETCSSGHVCQLGVAVDCDDENPCTDDACTEPDGDCSHMALEDGTSCGQAAQQCIAGECPADPCRLHVDAGAAGSFQGWSWVTASADLAGTLERAASLVGDCATVEVWVKEGVYVPDPADRTGSFLVADAVQLYGGFAGGESERAERDPQSHPSVLSGDVAGDDERGSSYPGNADEGTLDDNAQRIVTLAGGASSATVVDGFVISGAYNDGDGYGGGMYNDGGAATVNDVVFEHNWVVAGGAYNGGGGFMNRYGTPSLTGVSFRYNTVRPADGGGGYQGGGGMYDFRGEPLVRDASFTGNVVFDSLPDTTNPYRGGGGLYAFGLVGDDPAYPRLINVRFESNAAGDHGHQYSGGGGVMNMSTAMLLTNVVFLSNSAPGMGRGGGFYDFQNSTEVSPVLTNATFAGNRAGDLGGGLYTQASSGTLSLRNSVFYDNGSEIVGNAFEVTYCCVPGAATGTQTVDCASSPFVDYPDDLTPAAGSPIHDSGDDALNGELTDAAGNPRFVDTIDRGAYERQ